MPLAHTQPAAFVVGPGFLPVPGKTVTNIISGQYLDLATLLAKPSDMRSPSPLISIDGQVVVSQAGLAPDRYFSVDAGVCHIHAYYGDIFAQPRC